jgi:hypothetical protein
MTELDQILKKLAEQFDDINAKIEAINEGLREALNDR